MVYPTQTKIDKIKYIVSDLDGTLYGSNGKVSEASIQTLLHLQQKGYTLIIATGRYYYEITSLIAQLQLKKYGGYALCCNGGIIYDCRNDSQIPFPFLKQEELIQLTSMAKQNGLSTYVNYNEHYQFVPCTFHHVMVSLSKLILFPAKLMLSDTHKISRLYRAHITTQLNKQITSLPKICFLGSPKHLANFKKEVTALHKPYVFYPSGNHALEITHEEVGKHIAMQYVVKQYQDTMDFVLFFGDSGNDVALLKQAGIGVAMKNAEKECLDATIYHSDFTNKEDGVVNYLKNLSL